MTDKKPATDTEVDAVLRKAGAEWSGCLAAKADRQRFKQVELLQMDATRSLLLTLLVDGTITASAAIERMQAMGMPHPSIATMYRWQAEGRKAAASGQAYTPDDSTD